jgi:hypothetical protein
VGFTDSASNIVQKGSCLHQFHVGLLFLSQNGSDFHYSVDVSVGMGRSVQHGHSFFDDSFQPFYA